MYCLLSFIVTITGSGVQLMYESYGHQDCWLQILSCSCSSVSVTGALYFDRSIALITILATHVTLSQIP